MNIDYEFFLEASLVLLQFIVILIWAVGITNMDVARRLYKQGLNDEADPYDRRGMEFFVAYAIVFTLLCVACYFAITKGLFSDYLTKQRLVAILAVFVIMAVPGIIIFLAMDTSEKAIEKAQIKDAKKQAKREAKNGSKKDKKNNKPTSIQAMESSLAAAQAAKLNAQNEKPVFTVPEPAQPVNQVVPNTPEPVAQPANPYPVYSDVNNFQNNQVNQAVNRTPQPEDISQQIQQQIDNVGLGQFPRPIIQQQMPATAPTPQPVPIQPQVQETPVQTTEQQMAQDQFQQIAGQLNQNQYVQNVQTPFQATPQPVEAPQPEPTPAEPEFTGTPNVSAMSDAEYRRFLASMNPKPTQRTAPQPTPVQPQAPTPEPITAQQPVTPTPQPISVPQPEVIQPSIPAQPEPTPVQAEPAPKETEPVSKTDSGFDESNIIELSELEMVSPDTINQSAPKTNISIYDEESTGTSQNKDDFSYRDVIQSSLEEQYKDAKDSKIEESSNNAVEMSVSELEKLMPEQGKVPTTIDSDMEASLEEFAKMFPDDANMYTQSGEEAKKLKISTARVENRQQNIFVHLVLSDKNEMPLTKWIYDALVNANFNISRFFIETASGNNRVDQNLITSPADLADMVWNENAKSVSMVFKYADNQIVIGYTVKGNSPFIAIRKSFNAQFSALENELNIEKE